MANFMDYLDWRGDLTFEQSPINEVDNLILAYLSYVKLDDVAPGFGEGPLSIREMSEQFFEIYTQEELDADKSFIRLAPYLMKKMAESARFEDAQIQNYINVVNKESNIQFCAMEIVLNEEYSYIAYRGTDDSIVGWKEDFYLSNGVVAAEQEAVNYLNKVAALSERKLLVGGHSKGGNLAIYAAVGSKDEYQDRIVTVYNNDGPGFTKEFLESEKLVRVRPKIRRYIPESSIIGMLLEHTVDPYIIKSSQKAILQHDGFSWEVLGTKFPRCKELSQTGKTFDETIRSWINGMDAESRKKFIDDLFSVMEATGADSITEIQNGGLKSVTTMIAKAETLDPQSKKIAEELIKTLFSHLTDFIHLPSIHLGKKEEAED